MSEQPVRRRRKRRRRAGGLTKAVRYCLALAAVAIGVGIFFKTSDIRVEGNTLYSDEEILAVAGLREGKSLFFAERGAAEKRLCSELPYIDKADIRIKAPDTIIIHVEESAAAASLPYDGGYITVHKHCKGLAISERAEKTLVTGLEPVEAVVGTVLKTKAEDSVKLTYLVQLLTLLEEKGMITEVSAVDVSKSTDIALRYEDRLTVRMGGYDKTEYKLEFLSGILKGLGPDAAGTIDFTGGGEGHYIPD